MRIFFKHVWKERKNEGKCGSAGEERKVRKRFTGCLAATGSHLGYSHATSRLLHTMLFQPHILLFPHILKYRYLKLHNYPPSHFWTLYLIFTFSLFFYLIILYFNLKLKYKNT